MTDNEIIEQLRIDIKQLDLIYKRHKNYCLNFMRKMHNDLDVILEIYHDAVIVLYEKVQDKSFQLSCNIQTYLNSVCRNQLLNRFKKTSKSLVFTEDFDENIKDCLEEEQAVKEENLKQLENSLAQMKTEGSKCYEILKRYYYNNQSMDEIAVDLAYTNGDNVKNQKARCVKKLKEKLTNPSKQLQNG